MATREDLEAAALALALQQLSGLSDDEVARINGVRVTIDFAQPLAGASIDGVPSLIATGQPTHEASEQAWLALPVSSVLRTARTVVDAVRALRSVSVRQSVAHVDFGPLPGDILPGLGIVMATSPPKESPRPDEPPPPRPSVWELLGDDD